MNPVSQAKEPFRKFPECSTPSCCRTTIVNDTQYVRHRVLWGCSQTGIVYGFYDFQIVHVVAHISYLVDAGSGLKCDSIEVGVLVVYAKKEMLQLELFGASLYAQ